MNKKSLPEPEINHFYSKEEFLEELKNLPSFTIETARYIGKKEIEFILNPGRTIQKVFSFFQLRRGYNQRIDFVSELLNNYYGDIRTKENMGLVRKMAKTFYGQNKREINDLYARTKYKKQRMNRDIANNFI